MSTIESLLVLQNKDPGLSEVLKTIQCMRLWIFDIERACDGYFQQPNVMPESTAILFKIGTFAEQYLRMRQVLKKQIAKRTRKTTDNFQAVMWFEKCSNWLVEMNLGMPLPNEPNDEKKAQSAIDINRRMEDLYAACKKARCGDLSEG